MSVPWHVCENFGYKEFHFWHYQYYFYLPLVTCLSALTRLSLASDPSSRVDRPNRHPPLPIRVVIHALTVLRYKGDSDYLKDMVSRIIAPLLDKITITFFNQLVFDTPLLCHLIRPH